MGKSLDTPLGASLPGKLCRPTNLSQPGYAPVMRYKHDQFNRFKTGFISTQVDNGILNAEKNELHLEFRALAAVIC